MKTLPLLIALSAILAGCVSSPVKKNHGDERQHAGDVPEWVNNAPERSGFAYGVGSSDFWGDRADAIRRAGDSARVNLVSQLKVTVSGDFSSDVQERSATGRQTELVKTVRNTVRSQVPPVELDEVQITESVISGKYAYALAELDRSAAAERLRRQIEEMDQSVLRIGKLPREGSVLDQARVVIPALKLFVQRQRLEEQLALVSIRRTSPDLPDNVRAVRDTIYDLLDQLKVRVEMTSSDAQEIAGSVTEALTEKGIRVSSSGVYDLLVKISADLRAVERDNTHYVFADSRVQVMDSQGRILSTFSEEAKGASGYPELARKKAAKNVAEYVSEELAVTLVERIN